MTSLLERFLSHFHSLPGIDPALTNTELVERLLNCFSQRLFDWAPYPRGTGVTRTVVEFLKWMPYPTIYVVRTSDEAKRWKRDGIPALGWRSSFSSLSPRPSLVVCDNVLSLQDKASPRRIARFCEYFERLPFPVLVIDDGSTPLLFADRTHVNGYYNAGTTDLPRWIGRTRRDAAEELEIAADYLEDAGFEFASTCLRRQGQALRLGFGEA